MKGGSSGGSGNKQCGSRQQPQYTATVVSYQGQGKYSYGYATNHQSQHSVNLDTEYGQVQHGIHQKDNHCPIADHQVQHGIQQNTNYGEFVNVQVLHGHSQPNYDGEIMNYQSQHGVQKNVAYRQVANQEADYVLEQEENGIYGNMLYYLYQHALQAQGNCGEPQHPWSTGTLPY